MYQSTQVLKEAFIVIKKATANNFLIPFTEMKKKIDLHFLLKNLYRVRQRTLLITTKREFNQTREIIPDI